MFVKLYHQILDSSIAGNRRLRHFFTDLLLCADPDGYVQMTKEAIARRITAPLSEVEWGIRELMKPDPISKSPDLDGARIEPMQDTGYGWRIVNFDRYKAMKSAEDLRRSNRERVAKCREIKRKLPTSPEAIEVAKLFNRKLTTEWNEKEISAFKKAKPDIDIEDFPVINKYYAFERAKERGMHRRDLVTFLNNYSTEVDRAKGWAASAANMNLKDKLKKDEEKHENGFWEGEPDAV